MNLWQEFIALGASFYAATASASCAALTVDWIVVCAFFLCSAAAVVIGLDARRLSQEKDDDDSLADASSAKKKNKPRKKKPGDQGTSASQTAPWATEAKEAGAAAAAEVGEAIFMAKFNLSPPEGSSGGPGCEATRGVEEMLDHNNIAAVPTANKGKTKMKGAKEASGAAGGRQDEEGMCPNQDLPRCQVSQGICFI